MPVIRYGPLAEHDLPIAVLRYYGDATLPDANGPQVVTWPGTPPPGVIWMTRSFGPCGTPNMSCPGNLKHEVVSSSHNTDQVWRQEGTMPQARSVTRTVR